MDAYCLGKGSEPANADFPKMLYELGRVRSFVRGGQSQMLLQLEEVN